MSDMLDDGEIKPIICNNPISNPSMMLGIASIRDRFSDILFPGTSTIQTRAKYFL
jgi:hypothetical protein